MKKNEKGFSLVEGLLIVVVVGLISFVGWYVWHSNKNVNKAANTATNQIPVKLTPAYVNADWQSYKSTTEGFTLQYPKDWKLVPVDISGSSSYISEQIALKSTNDFHLDLDIVKTKDLGGSSDCSAATNLSAISGPGGSKLYVNIYTEVGTLSDQKKVHYQVGLSQWSGCNQPLHIGPYYPATKVNDAAVRLSGEFSKSNCGPVGCDPTSMSLEEFSNKDEVKTATLILQSLHY